MVIDTINLANFAYENGFEELNIVDPNGVEKYNTILKPKILEFERRHGNTPNMILKNFMKKYIERKDLSNNFSSQGFHFKGQGRVHTNTWACIYSKDVEDLKKGYSPATQLPQLYFTISQSGIEFGFSYGYLVKENAIQVQIVRENPELLNKIIEYLQRDNELIIAGNVLSNDGKTYERVKIDTIGDLTRNWSNTVWIGKAFLQNKIDDNVEETITETFDNLLEFFKFTSLSPPTTTNPPPLPIQPDINYWQITLGEDATKWDEWKKNNIIAMGFKEMIQSAGEKVLELSEDEIKKLYRDTYPENPNPDEETDNIINFLQNMKDGHYVLIDQGGSVLGWGIIKSGPKYGYSQEFPVYRQIEWKNTAIQEIVTDDNKE